MKSMKSLPLIAAITPLWFTACNYTPEGECWYKDQGSEGAGAGAGAGGPILPPTPPGGDHGFGDGPPSEPQDANDPRPPKCNKDEESPTQGIAGCSLGVDYPHLSGHKTGTVNVEARVQCNRPVSGLEMTLGLARDGQEVIRHTFTNSGVASLGGNVATTLPCVSGAYQGAAAAIVTFPSPSLPANGILNANSSTRQISCP